MLRLLRGAAWGLAWAIVFALMLVVSTLVHVDTPALRSSVAVALNGALAGAYRGRIEISEIERLGVFRAGIRELRVFGEAGEPLIVSSGIKLQYHPFALLRAVIGAQGAPLIVDHVRIDEARVIVALDSQTGEWSLVRALSKPPKVRPSSPGRVPSVYAFSTIEIGKLELVTEHPSFGKLEARIDRLQGGATVGGSDNSVTVERFGVRLTAPDGSHLDGTGSFQLLPKGFVAGTFHGFLDGTEIDASGRWDDGVLALRLAVPLALPEQVRRRIPDWPLAVPLVAEANAQGPPDALRIQGRLRAQNSGLEIDGTARLSAPASARFALRAHNLDPRLFGPAAPSVRLDARADAEVRFESAGPTVTLRGTTEPTAIGAVALPGTSFTLQIERGRVRGQLTGADARGQIEAAIDREAGSPTSISLAARQLELQAFPQLRVRGRLDGALQAALAGGEISGTFDTDVRGLRAPAVGIERARAAGSFAGQLDALRELRLDAKLTATRAELGGSMFDTAIVTAYGSLWRNRLEASVARGDGQGRASGVFHLDDDVWFEAIEAAWSTPALALAARANRVAPERGELRGGVFELSGSSGSLKGTLELAPNRVQAEADADGFDVGALARVLGLGSQRLVGRVSGHAELTQGRAGDGRGVLDIELRDLGAFDVALGSLELEARLDGYQLDAELATQSSPLGALSANARLQLGGQALAVRSWQRSTGQVSAKLTQLPLWPLGFVVAKHSRVKELDGRLEVALQMERSDPEALPNVFLQARTTELAFDLANGASGSEGSSGRFERFGVHTSASIDGASGHGAATLVVTDEHGALVTTSGSLALDLAALLSDPRFACTPGPSRSCPLLFPSQTCRAASKPRCSSGAASPIPPSRSLGVLSSCSAASLMRRRRSMLPPASTTPRAAADSSVRPTSCRPGNGSSPRASKDACRTRSRQRTPWAAQSCAPPRC
jgi:hypothetical protein